MQKCPFLFPCLTVMSSNSEKSFLNFPGHFWKEGVQWELDLKGIVCEHQLQTHTHLPGLVESTDCCRVQTHDDGKRRVQISLGFTTANTWTRQKLYQITVKSHFAWQKCDRMTTEWVFSYWAAILMNFLSSCTLLLSDTHMSTSDMTHCWTSLQRCRRTESAAVWPLPGERLRV